MSFSYFVTQYNWKATSLGLQLKIVFAGPPGAYCWTNESEAGSKQMDVRTKTWNVSFVSVDIW